MIILNIFIRYPLSVLISWIGTLSAFILAPILCLFLDAEGNLKFLRSIYQPPDNKAIGDDLWKLDKPNYSNYQLAVSYLWRNPAQGLDQWLKVDVSRLSAMEVSVYGKLNINDTGSDGAPGHGGAYLLLGGGVFQFRAVIPCGFGKCLNSGLGWRLEPIVKGYPSTTLGALIATPFRFYKFV